MISAGAPLAIQTPKPVDPNSDAPLDYRQIQARYQAAGQGHLLTFYDDLPKDKQESLLKQLHALNVERANRIHQKATTCPSPLLNNQSVLLGPLPEECFDSTLEASPEKIEQWQNEGLKQISKNKVGVILLAGGQGTRLGSSAPKGCYNINLPSVKTLFQIQAERILRLQKLASQQQDAKAEVIIPWYVMTSGPTRPATVKFFEEHDYFGLKSENIIFFEQGKEDRPPPLPFFYSTIGRFLQNRGFFFFFVIPAMLRLSTVCTIIITVISEPNLWLFQGSKLE